MSTRTSTLEKGKVYVLESEPIALHESSNFYAPNARVIPDEQNFLTCLTNDGKVALHESELAYRAINCLDENGDEKLVIRDEYPFISATTSNGRNKYFLNEQSAENANFKFSFRLSRFHDANCSEFYGNDKVLSYHTAQRNIDKTRLKKYHNDSDEWLVGVEVEKVDWRMRDEGSAWEILSTTGWSKEVDGSLGSEGYELVSPILPLFDNNRLESAMVDVKKYINAQSNSDCGGHINISRKNVESSDLLESFKQFAPIIYSLYPKRLTNRFCKAKQWSKYFTYPEKYSAFHIKQNGVVEIRLFSRVTNIDALRWRLELLRLLITDGGNLNQLSQKIGCQESVLYKHFRKQYSHEKIGEKLMLIDKYAKMYGTHRNGISASVKTRINNTMSFDVFSHDYNTNY
jgi:hypothetical protein